jgi:putative restriction endonuclease
MKYVGWAEIVGPPAATGRTAGNGQALYAVEYRAPAAAFDTPVPREVMGEPIERWLRQLPRGRQRNVATFGRAVRPLLPIEFEEILRFGGAGVLEIETQLVNVHERVAALVNQFRRSETFRREVVLAYGQRCAVSGLSLGSVPITKAHGLLDAAHIRPVAQQGPHSVSNGMPLTPTLHRMFDAGLFSALYDSGVPRLIISPRLERRMIRSDDGRSELRLEEGQQLLMPQDRAAWPDPRQLLFHRDHIYLAD